MTKVFISGAAGQDGSYLIDLLLKKNYEIYALVRRSSTHRLENIAHNLDKITLIYGDVTDLSCLTHTLKDIFPDEIYHLAAQSHVGISNREPLATMQVTGMGTFNMLEAIRLAGLTDHVRFYNASTSEIIGQANDKYFIPRSPYAIAKQAGYFAVKMYREAYGMYACSGISYNHMSPRQSLDFLPRLVTDGIARIKYGLQDKITVGNIETYRDWGYALRYAEAFIEMLNQPFPPEDVVIATGNTYSGSYLIETACTAAHLPLHWSSYVHVDQSRYRPNEVYFLQGDNRQAYNILKWTHPEKFENVVALMVDADIDRIEKEIVLNHNG